MIKSTIGYPFTAAEMQDAHEQLGANCGPAALAFALRIKPDVACRAISGFAQKRYTSPTMMKQALAAMNRPYDVRAEILECTPFSWPISLTRVQWTGPWTKPGSNPRWAYGATHWIATWIDYLGGEMFVFDCNGGIRPFDSWKKEIVPLLTGATRRADGGWYATHVWRLRKMPHA